MGVMMDAWWCLPTKRKVQARAAKDGTDEAAALAKMLEEREELIKRSREDPYNFVTEPDIWLVCDAIMDFPWCSDLTRAKLMERLNRMPNIVAEYGESAISGGSAISAISGEERGGSGKREKRITWENAYEVWKRAIRKKLGMKRPARHLLIPGTNRSSKSNYCVSRATRCACQYDWRMAGEQDVRCYFMHESNKRIREDQMPLIFQYMPKELKEEAIKKEGTYVSYKPATGFSNDMFLTPNGIRGYFRSYEQDIDVALEGFTAKMVLAEENVPFKWADRIFTRLSDKNGWYLQPFTPIHGWTATVGMFQAGMRVVREIPAYVLPADMGPVDIPSAVGLTPAEYEHVEACKWQDPPRQAQCPRSRPEDCVSWLEEDGGRRAEDRGRRTEDGGRKTEGGGQRTEDGEQRTESRGRRTEGGGRRTEDRERRFERVPRVALCTDERKAVVWFSPTDNPYSDAADVIKNNLPKGRDEVLKCVYGVAVKSFSAKFARFGRDTHVVRAEQIPQGGLNGLVIDPAGTRNWAMAWYRVVGDSIYFYREFPSPTRLTPGVGAMGLWAEPDDRNGGVNDGRKGPGQEPLGWSYLRYKAEIARLEGWKDWRDWEEMAAQHPEEYWNGSCLVPTDAEVEAWDEDNGSEERTDKIGDVRALSTPKQEKDRFETMQTILDETGLRLDFADGVDVEDAVSVINHMLDYEKRMKDEGKGQKEEEREDGDGTANQANWANREQYMRAPKMFFSEECVNLICAMENWQNSDGLKGAYKDFVDLVRYAVLRMKKPEFRRRSMTVVRSSAGRAAAPGVGRVGMGKDEGRRMKEEGYESVMGAGGRCVMRMRRR
jgi:hypothetical protein